MKLNLLKFKTYCKDRGWQIDRFTSEFTIQFRLCRFLESIDPQYRIELESNIVRYELKGLIKKEIDIDVLDLESRAAIEIKYLRDKGSYNIGMFNYYADIKFIEELVETKKFEFGYCVLFTSLSEVYDSPRKKLNPKYNENLPLYTTFKKDKVLKGTVQIKTGNLNKSVKIKGSYSLNWRDFDQDIKACIIKIQQ